MTQTLTTERLREIAEDGFLEHGDSTAIARELLANREARPYGYLREEDGRIQISIGHERPHDRSGGYATPWAAIYARPPAVVNPEITPASAVTGELLEAIDEVIRISDRDYEAWSRAKAAIAACRAVMLAQPVSQGCKLPPHAYRELVNVLRDTAVKYNGTDQLRERLNTALSQFIEPDHPHTRSAPQERN